jgi:dTDP-4-dehydrorhamnose 3,5-epimerase
MIFHETKLPGVFLLPLEAMEDERGFFARTFCQREFAGQGLAATMVQANVSYNRLRGTLRGMHYQAEPYGEAKLIRCTSGAIFDVVIDLRPESPTYMHWLDIELAARDRRLLYIPEGCAHGFQTLVGDTEVFYQMSQFYVPEAVRGVRYNDPLFGIAWPLPVEAISNRDRQFADYQPVRAPAVPAPVDGRAKGVFTWR